MHSSSKKLAPNKYQSMRSLWPTLLIPCVLLLAACGSSPTRKVGAGDTVRTRAAHEKASEVVLFSLGLINTGYRFGGKNPEAGLDCSGMVSYVFDQAANLRLQGSAADLARLGRAVDMAQMQPGDLVFFNTGNRPHSHVGIYIGEGRFIHAPNSRGKVRIDSLTNGWFAARFEEARNYFE
ncbi:MAG: peptidoglycan endopeptidase [Rugosibacter sp.]|nr:MAG: peptidoglycan endopeptidase [Rugosibacter sp.]TBR09082.1 MAG: peptidoglycan endopeptidase [Rugosibacter sp.]